MRWGAALLLLGGCQGEPRAEVAPATAAQAEAPQSLERLVIRTARGERVYQVEVARTAEQQQLGLMYRTSIAADRGMIFPMSPPRLAAFWMKNTLIPLDMIFIRGDGTIASIAENTVPQSLEIVESGEPVAAVLEIAGGGARRAGIAAGDRVIWAG